MQSSSDWIAAMAGTPERSAQDAIVAPSGWLDALAQKESTPAGFRDEFPFASRTRVSEPEPAPVAEITPVMDASHENAEAIAYDKGFAEGRQEAERIATHQIEKERAHWQTLRLAFRKLDQVARETLAQELELTVKQLCQQVLGDYAVDSEALLARCKQAADRLGAAPADIALHIHPDTRAQLDRNALADWTVRDDPSLVPGTIRLTHPDGTVRDGPEDWARAIAEALGA